MGRSNESVAVIRVLIFFALALMVVMQVVRFQISRMWPPFQPKTWPVSWRAIRLRPVDDRHARTQRYPLRPSRILRSCDQLSCWLSHQGHSADQQPLEAIAEE